LPIRERRNGTCVRSIKGAHLVLGARPRHALADDDERPVGPLEQVQCPLEISGSV
jgi:hypothetical protein